MDYVERQQRGDRHGGKTGESCCATRTSLALVEIPIAIQIDQLTISGVKISWAITSGARQSVTMRRVGLRLV